MAIHNLPQLKDAGDLAGTRVLVRASLNVPIGEGDEVLNQFRLMRGLPTIKYLTSQGAKVILMGHIGRDPEETLLPVYRHLLRHFDLSFTYDVTGEETQSCVSGMQDGQVVLLENLRQDPRERENDPGFARELADLADVYVNDAFSVSHRVHTSIVGVPQYLPAYAGLSFVHEYEELTKAMHPPEPSLFILGGAKFDTKLPLIEEYLKIYDHVFVGGALANDLFKAQGHEVGSSLVSDTDLSDGHLLRQQNLLLPVDVIVSGEDGAYITTPDDVDSNEIILDAGPETVEMLGEYIKDAKTVLWNGPLGNYEVGCDEATHGVARSIAASSAYSVIGGGDTVASIEALDLQDKFSFLSTAGGAMLKFLEHGTLPAIEALIKSHE